jgi:DNA-binding transcriptional ArsR family regulator
MRPQQETFEIEDVRVLEVLNNPVRLRIMHQLMVPTTARELAQRLDVPVTRLYYHLNLLQEMGVIEVVETRKSGAMLQRVYRAVASDFAPVRGLLEKSVDKDRVVRAAIGMVLDGARLDATAALLGPLGVNGGENVELDGALGRSVVPLSRKSALRIVELIDAVVEEMREHEDRQGEEYAFSFVFFPMVGPVKGESL